MMLNFITTYVQDETKLEPRMRRPHCHESSTRFLGPCRQESESTASNTMTVRPQPRRIRQKIMSTTQVNH